MAADSILLLLRNLPHTFKKKNAYIPTNDNKFNLKRYNPH